VARRAHAHGMEEGVADRRRRRPGRAFAGAEGGPLPVFQFKMISISGISSNRKDRIVLPGARLHAARVPGAPAPSESSSPPATMPPSIWFPDAVGVHRLPRIHRNDRAAQADLLGDLDLGDDGAVGARVFYIGRNRYRALPLCPFPEESSLFAPGLPSGRARAAAWITAFARGFARCFSRESDRIGAGGRAQARP